MSLAVPVPAASFKYIRIGQKADAQTKTIAGAALMGGGADLDEAFRWLCERGGGGDLLILRAAGDDDYNSYVNRLCQTNSVATLVIPNREAAQEPAVATTIRRAEALFIAGGDQSRYVKFWRNTPVQDAINEDIKAGKPIGGTSAGLAILSEFGYGALNDKEDDNDLSSDEVLGNPYFGRVTLVRDFLNVPQLENLITDTHFATRKRMGRSLGFLARLMQDGWAKSPREIAVDEKSAVLVDEHGKSLIVGTGRGAYFLDPREQPIICKKGEALTFENIKVYRAPAGAHFDLTSWSGSGGTSYSLSIKQGKITSNQAGGDIY
jgi:cyanophycinase